MSIKSKDVCVIGAGPAGLTAALKLQESGIPTTLIEADNQVGGMAKSLVLWGQVVDLGPHRFFSKDPRVNSFWLSYAGDYSYVNRLTRIYFNGKFFSYPLKPLEALTKLGVWLSLQCILSALLQKVKTRFLGGQPPNTFEAWVSQRFGYKLFSIFFKTYSEKLWGIPCNKLDSDFAAQRIKKFSLFEAIKAAIGFSRQQHLTLVDRFAYPQQGSGSVYENMANHFEKCGGTLLLGTSVINVESKEADKVTVVTSEGRVMNFGHIISTMPITKFASFLSPPNEVIRHISKLQFRNTILVYLLVDESELFPDQWLYIHSDAVKSGRVTNFRNWVPEICRGSGQTILCFEYWCDEDDDLWFIDDGSLFEIAVRDFMALCFSSVDKVAGYKVVKVPKCYPRYQVGYKQDLQVVQDFLDGKPWATVIGRYGSFKYNNQDHSLLMGLLAAEKIISGVEFDLWELNTDFEYQEDGRLPDDDDS